MSSTLTPGTNVIFEEDPTVVGVVLEGATTTRRLHSIEEVRRGDVAFTDAGLVPVQWRHVDGSRYEHWEDAEALKILDRASLSTPVDAEGVSQ